MNLNRDINVWLYELFRFEQTKKNGFLSNKKNTIVFFFLNNKK